MNRLPLNRLLSTHLLPASLLATAALFVATPLLAAAPAAPAPVATAPASQADQAALTQILAGAWRTPANSARDQYRHPLETLGFFGIAPDQTVIEISPSGGWYSEILAPYLREHGRFIYAVNDPAKSGRGADYAKRTNDALAAKFAADPAVYDRAVAVRIDPAAPSFGAPASVDAVLTFRNVHNWRMDGTADKMFAGFFAVLKPGGTLGVVEHRAAADVADGDRSGYVGQAQVIALATAAGFELVGGSEINANPNDSKDYADGVWTLPPVLRLGDKDKAKYLAIGESDRMTLKFLKPVAAATP